MKKIFSFLAAAAMLFAASCTKDNVGTDNGNDTQVTFNLSLEGQSGTRAIGDGAGVTKLYYYIFDVKTGERLNHYDYENQTFSTVTPKIQLAKDQRYKAVFWAQKETSAYTIEKADDKSTVNIKVNYAENANDEARDAFYGVVEFTVTGSERIDVLLTRPFAQLNVGVTEADYSAAFNSGVTITESYAEVIGVYNTLDLFDGSVDGKTTAVFARSGRPTETLTVGQDAFVYLSMNYVLVGAKENVAAEFEFYSNNGKKIDFKSGLDVIPVQRNYRTNLVGQILTGNLDFNVTIDEDFENNHNANLNEATTVAELKLAAKNGGTITLAANIEITEPLVFEKSSILNLNGKTLKGAVVVPEGGNLIVNEGVIENTNENNSGITSNGNLTLNDVNITSARHALRVESGNVVINGGTYKVAPQSAKTVYALNIGDDGKVANVTIKGGTFVGPKGTMADSGGAIAVRAGSKATIEGGNFSGGKNKTLSNKGTMIITGGTFDQDPAAILAEGYKALAKDGKYYVVTEQVDAIVSNGTELQEALDNGEDVVLSGDFLVDVPAGSNGYGKTGFNQNGGVLDGGNYTLGVEGATATWDSAISTRGGTIKNITVAKGFRGIFIKTGTEKVILENVVIDGTTYTISCDEASGQGLEAYNSTFKGWTSFAATLGTAYFKNCTFGAGAGNNFSRPYAPTTYVNCNFEAGHKVDPRGKVTFENCTIGGVALTAENLATLVTSNIANATVK